MSDVIGERLRAVATAEMADTSLEHPRAVEGGGAGELSGGNDGRRPGRWLWVAAAAAVLLVGSGSLLLVRRDDGGVVDRPTTTVPEDRVSAARRLSAAVTATWTTSYWRAEVRAGDGRLVERLTWDDGQLEIRPVDPPGVTTVQTLSQLVQDQGGGLVLSIDEPTGTAPLTQYPSVARRCVEWSARVFVTWVPDDPAVAARPCPSSPEEPKRGVGAPSDVSGRIDDRGRISESTSTYRGETVRTTFDYTTLSGEPCVWVVTMAPAATDADRYRVRSANRLVGSVEETAAVIRALPNVVSVTVPAPGCPVGPLDGFSLRVE